MSQSMRRVIFLVDMNAFFISCETSINPKLKGHPAAVAGNPKNRTGIILAANYEARAFGVKTTMLIHEALKLCPDLILVPPTRGLYEQKSVEVMEILSRFTPVIQQNSIDEAWMDLTGCEGLFGEPLIIAKNIMDSIRKELDLWCSIGISENKFLSKMASEFKKPLGITELWKKDIKQKLWPLKVGEMYGVGKKTEKKLNQIGIMTIGQLANSDRKMLISSFGKYGDELKRLANGIDSSPVTPNPRYESKSIGRTTTLSEDTTDIEFARSVLLRLAEEVGEEARKHGFKGKTVSIVIRYNDFKTITRQKSIALSFLTKEIYKAGCELLEANWNTKKPVRLLGIGLSNIDEDLPDQLSIFDTNEDLPDEIKRQERLERTMDEIRMRFGSDKLIRATLIDGESEKKEK